MPRSRIGLFGGTFDPPHVGHLILSSEALHQLKLARLLWVLTPLPPHKRDQLITSVEHRLAMLQLAIADNPAFELSRLELDRPGPHYTLDTVQLLAAQQPQADIILLLGSDSLGDLPAWHFPTDLLAACYQVGVMHRPGNSVDLSTLDSVLPGIKSKVKFIDAPLLEIASSEIRLRVKSGEPFRYYLLPSVYEFIQKHNLYRDPGVPNRK
jgi:nicotinate-nucleotide adenylyltransferase